MKLKPLLPSLKEKRRYIGFEVISKKQIPFSKIRDNIMSKYKELFGIIGLAKVNLKVLNEWKDKKGIMKVNNKYVDEAKSSLALIKKIDNQDVIVRCIGVSGILKKLKSKHMEG